MHSLAKLFAFVSRDRKWLTLLVVGAAAAWIYVQWAETRKREAEILAGADAICAAAGTDYAASTAIVIDAEGKRRTVEYPAGQRCRAAVAGAVAFRTDAQAATAAQLAAAMREREGKAAADSVLARQAAEAARDAAHRMEIADAEADRTNRVDRDWFAALNDVGGLRAPRR